MRKAAVRILPISMTLGLAGALALGCGGSQGSRTGTAGTTGSGGGAAPYTCTPASTLDCTGSGLITYALADGTITSFSMQEWSNTAGKFCNATGLRGAIYGYNDGHAAVDGGGVSSNSQNVDTTGNRVLSLNWDAEAAGWAGGGLSFDSCVNASAFTALQFTATVTAGSLANCQFQVGLATQDERPTTQMSPPGGTCDPNGSSSCYRYPTVMNLADPGASVMTYTLPFSSFMMSTPQSSVPPQNQLVGIQWQVNDAAPSTDGGAQMPCVVSIAIDDIKFVM